MQQPAAPGREPIRETALVEHVSERVAGGDHPVRPGLGAARAQEPLRPHEPLAHVLHLRHLRTDRRGDRLRAELEAGDAPGLEHGYLERLETEDLRLEQLLQTPRNVPFKGGELAPHGHPVSRLLEAAPYAEMIDRGHQEQRVAVGMRMQHRREPDGHLMTAEARREVGLDPREREAVQRELHAATVHSQRTPQGVERARAHDHVCGAEGAEQEKPCPLGALGENRDEIDGAGIGPVQILEDQDERHVAGQLLHELRKDTQHALGRRSGQGGA